MKIGNQQNLFNNGMIPTEAVGSTSTGQIQGLDANGNVPMTSGAEQEYVQEIDIRKTVAAEKGYEATANENVFKKDASFVVWDEEKQKFVKNKNILKVYANGYMEENVKDFYDTRTHIISPDGKDIGRKGMETLAKVAGLQKPDKEWTFQHLWKELYYNPRDKQYYVWNKDTGKFHRSNVQSLAGHNAVEYKNGTCYRYVNGDPREISPAEFYAEKLGFYEDEKEKGLYWSRTKDDMNDYIFDLQTKSFVERITEDEIIRAEMTANKADGIVDNFTQQNTGDCYLLAAIQALRPIMMEKTTDKDGNTVEKIKSEYLEIDPETGDMTVKLRGPNFEYKITNEEINAALSEQNPKYSYGEKEIVAIEMAVEKFFKEAFLEKNVGYTKFTARGGIFSEADILSGGYASTAIHLLTGLNTNVVQGNEVQAGTIEKLIDSKQYICADIKFDGKNEIHAVAIVGYDDKNIYYNDSNKKTDEPEAKPIQEFYGMLAALHYTDGETKLHKSLLAYFQRKFGL